MHYRRIVHKKEDEKLREFQGLMEVKNKMQKIYLYFKSFYAVTRNKGFNEMCNKNSIFHIRIKLEFKEF